MASEAPHWRKPRQIIANCIRVRRIPATEYKPSQYSVTSDPKQTLFGNGQCMKICADGVSEWEAAQKWIEKFIVLEAGLEGAALLEAGLEGAVLLKGYRFNEDVYFAWKFVQEDE